MITEHHGIYSVKNYIAKSFAEEIAASIKPILQTSPNPLVNCAFGFSNQAEARTVSMDNLVYPKTGNATIDKLSYDVTKIVMDVKALLEQTYNKTLHLIQLTYNQMNEGASNAVHVDDATGMYYQLEYAALLYTTSQGTDYTGGAIYFPNQELALSPEKGTLIFFKGDEDKPHGVKEVISGQRENIIMFFSSLANNSSTDD
jgi:hypothetical protein